MGVGKMNVLDVMKERRSTHHFKKERVNEKTLTEIFTYGSWAPTHYMKEPWNIKMYQEKGKKPFVDAIMSSYQRLGMVSTKKDEKALKTIHSMKSFLLDIPHHALINFNNEEDQIRFVEEYAAVCAFIQNAQLAAWTFGVGMLWTITPYMHDPEFVKEIGLNNEKVKIAAVMQIGYPKKISRNKGR